MVFVIINKIKISAPRN